MGCPSCRLPGVHLSTAGGPPFKSMSKTTTTTTEYWEEQIEKLSTLRSKFQKIADTAPKAFQAKAAGLIEQIDHDLVKEARFYAGLDFTQIDTQMENLQEHTEEAINEIECWLEKLEEALK